MQRLNSDIVRGIAQDNKGMIWIATDHGGINLLDKKDFSIKYILSDPDDHRSLSQNSINALYKDFEGIIWIGTFKKGISFYHEDILRFGLYSIRRRILPACHSMMSIALLKTRKEIYGLVRTAAVLSILIAIKTKIHSIR